MEIGAQALGLADAVVALRGFMSPPTDPAAAFFALSRTPLPNCPFCAPWTSWPDDIVAVHLRAPGVDVDHPLREVLVRERLAVGEADGPMPGLRSPAQPQTALWQPAGLHRSSKVKRFAPTKSFTALLRHSLSRFPLQSNKIEMIDDSVIRAPKPVRVPLGGDQMRRLLRTRPRLAIGTSICTGRSR